MLCDRGVSSPSFNGFPPGETIHPFTVTPTHLGFEELRRRDPDRVLASLPGAIEGELEVFSAPFRYVWPSELDLMARLAGMTLRERWDDWHRAPFTSESRQHISVWEKPS
jgi:hypothetical protein